MLCFVAVFVCASAVRPSGVHVCAVLGSGGGAVSHIAAGAEAVPFAPRRAGFVVSRVFVCTPLARATAAGDAYVCARGLVGWVKVGTSI